MEARLSSLLVLNVDFVSSSWSKFSESSTKFKNNNNKNNNNNSSNNNSNNMKSTRVINVDFPEGREKFNPDTHCHCSR